MADPRLDPEMAAFNAMMEVRAAALPPIRLAEPFDVPRALTEALNLPLAEGGPVMVAVHHLAAPERAERLAADLEEKVPGLRELYVSELGAAIGAHVGPGAVGLVVAPAGPPPPAAQQEDAQDR